MSGTEDDVIVQTLRAAGRDGPAVSTEGSELLRRGRTAMRRRRALRAGSALTVAAVGVAVALTTAPLGAEDIVPAGPDRTTTFVPLPESDQLAALAEEQGRAAADELAAGLGAGWVRSDDAGPDGFVTLTAEASAASGLPDGFRVLGSRTVQAVPLSACSAPMVEKGTIFHPCEEITTDAGQVVTVSRAETLEPGDPRATVPIGPAYFSADVIHRQADGWVVSVRLTAQADHEGSTPADRDAVRAWLSTQVDTLVAAATVGGLEPRSH